MSEILESTALIQAPAFIPDLASVQPSTLARVETAIAKYALFCKVDSEQKNQIAVNAQAELKALFNEIEKARKEVVAPFLEMQRRVNAAAGKPMDELKNEIERIAALTKPWLESERRRRDDEERAQREELARIERERVAEVERLAREQAKREREAAEAQAAADKAAREAAEAQAELDRLAALPKSAEPGTVAPASPPVPPTQLNELAEKIRTAETLQTVAAAKLEEVKTIAATVERVETAAGTMAYYASRPIARTIPKGQSGSRTWEFEVVNPYELAKHRPDLVTITPLRGKILAALNDLDEGLSLPGVTAKATVNTNVRAKRERPAIEA